MKNLKRYIKDREVVSNRLLFTKEDGVLLASAKNASSKAVRSSRALGITFKIIRGNEIIAINPDKSVTVIRKISKPTVDTSALRKGMILERK